MKRGKGMKEQERSIVTLGQPDLELLPKELSEIFYSVLLHEVQNKYLIKNKENQIELQKHLNRHINFI